MALQERRGGSSGAEAGRQRLQEVKKPPGAAGGAGGMPCRHAEGAGVGAEHGGDPCVPAPEKCLGSGGNCGGVFLP